MKQMYLLVLLLCISVASFAFGNFYSITQNNWRWRNNDGGEVTATWKTAQSTPISYRATDGVLRLRVEIINNSGYSNPSNCPPGEDCGERSHNIGVHLGDTLQYSTTPADSLSWKNIGLNLLQPFIIARDSSYVRQGESTTEQLTESDNSYPFQPGIIMVSDSLLSQDMDAHVRTEEEWSLKGTPHLIPNTTYYFRQKGYTTSAKIFNRYTYSYAQYPSLRTTSVVLPITVTRFTVSSVNGVVQADWVVASGEAAASFTLQRSTEGRVWTTVQTINTGSSPSYTAYDNTPPTGVNLYYRLQLVENGGAKSYSEIRQITLSANHNLVSVAPNPAQDAATLHFTGTAGTKYSLIITDLRGKPVWRKEDVAAQGNNQVSLPVKSLAKGMYIIRLANGSSVQNLKLIKGE